MDKIIAFLGFSVNIKELFKNDKSKKILLDPMTTILRLCVIGQMDDQLKIRIVNNKIEYQEKSVIRGITRWYNGDTKDILSNLHKPICLYIKKYGNLDIFKQLNKYAIDGLKKIKKTYKDYDLIEHSLQHYIKLIEGTAVDKELTEQGGKYYEIYDIWSESEIKLAYHLFIVYLEKKQLATLNALNEVLNGKDEKLRQIIIS